VPDLSATVPSLPEQAERLIELGVHRIARLTPDRVREAHRRPMTSLVVVHTLPDAVCGIHERQHRAQPGRGLG
jgi:hypothetical protein